MPDPRLGSPKSANEILLDRAIRHAILTERLKNHMVKEGLSIFNREVAARIVENVERRLSRIASRGRYSKVLKTKAVAQLFYTNREILRQGLREVRNSIGSELAAFSVAEVEWQLAVIESAVPVNLSLTRPSAAVLRSAVKSSPIVGKPLKAWFDGLELSTQDSLKREITEGLVSGDSVARMVRRVRGSRAAGFSNGVLSTTRRHAETIVRTAVTNVSTDARETAFAANTDVIEGVRIIATLDARTTPICMSLDGKIYPIGEGDRPPFHHQCRTVTAPVLKSWKDLGIDLKEAPEGTRAALGGPVPANQTYPEWLKGQPKKIQNLALGRGKADLWRAGKVSIDKFVDDRGRTLSLQALVAREGLN